jgi:flavin reductase (DIM6/NTAB) family NADH-FMN oxidoreductase RutF
MSLTDQFKASMGSWASGVSVVTTRRGDLLYGLTVSSLASVSADPAMVSVCVHNDNKGAAMIAESGRFAVSVLGDDQQEASNYFARSGREPTEDFVEVDGSWTGSGLPIVAGAIAWLVCDVAQAVSAGSHTLFVGRVTDAGSDEGRGPLLYWRRGYRKLDLLE